MHFKKLIQLFFSNFSNLILSDDFIARHRKNNSDFTRDSKLCFSDIILFLMRLPQKTLATEMSDFVSQCLGGKELSFLADRGRAGQQYGKATERTDYSFTCLLLPGKNLGFVRA